MAEQKKSFFAKKGIKVSDVMYITRNGRKTVVNLSNGDTLETFKPIKGILEGAPTDSFESINKGIVIAPRYIVDIRDNEYVMKDGKIFAGRVRITKKQKENMVRYSGGTQSTEWEEFAVLDKMPLAFCIIELVFNDKGHGVDFIFRYCNKEMETLEGKSLNEMLDRSFYEVFENGDRKWLITYADVALNGGKKVIDSYSPEIGYNLRIYCFQPKPNFCACALVKI